MDEKIIGAIIGVLGIIIGITISELFRRYSRIEKFYEAFFNEKIKIYVELEEKFAEIETLADSIRESKLSYKEKAWLFPAFSCFYSLKSSILRMNVLSN